MNEEVAKTLIVTLGGGLLSLAGIWIGKRPQPERRKPPTKEERRNDTALVDLVKELAAQQVKTYERQLTDLIGKVTQLEAQRDEREKRIDALEDENRELRETVERQETQIADLKTQLNLMQDREKQRDG